MSANRKLSFLGKFAESEPNGVLGRKYLEEPLCNIFEILDDRFYKDGRLDLKPVFGDHFLNSLDQVIFVGKHDSLELSGNDEMLPPHVIQFVTEFQKVDVVSPSLDKNYMKEC
jgi:hypothetical protein